MTKKNARGHIFPPAHIYDITSDFSVCLLLSTYREAHRQSRLTPTDTERASVVSAITVATELTGMQFTHYIIGGNSCYYSCYFRLFVFVWNRILTVIRPISFSKLGHPHGCTPAIFRPRQRVIKITWVIPASLLVKIPNVAKLTC